MRTKSCGILVPVLVLFLSVNAVKVSAQPFYLNPVTDGIIAGSAVILNGTDLLLDNVLDVNSKDFDGNILDKSDVNAFDRMFMNSYSKTLDNVGTVTCVLSALTPALILPTVEKDSWLTIGVMYAETLLLANGIKEIGKLCINRSRPYMYYDDYPEDEVDSGDWTNSFPSGHTTTAFAGATFASYVFCKYNPDSNWRIPVVASSYLVAASTAALRIASGNHFMTDVIAGAALGTVTGILVPWLHTFERKDVSVAVLPSGFYVKKIL